MDETPQLLWHAAPSSPSETLIGVAVVGSQFLVWSARALFLMEARSSAQDKGTSKRRYVCPLSDLHCHMSSCMWLHGAGWRVRARCSERGSCGRSGCCPMHSPDPSLACTRGKNYNAAYPLWRLVTCVLLHKRVANVACAHAGPASSELGGVGHRRWSQLGARRHHTQAPAAECRASARVTCACCLHGQRLCVGVLLRRSLAHALQELRWAAPSVN